MSLLLLFNDADYFGIERLPPVFTRETYRILDELKAAREAKLQQALEVAEEDPEEGEEQEPSFKGTKLSGDVAADLANLLQAQETILKDFRITELRPYVIELPAPVVLPDPEPEPPDPVFRLPHRWRRPPRSKYRTRSPEQAKIPFPFQPMPPWKARPCVRSTYR